MAVTYLLLNTILLLVLVRLQEYLISQIFGEVFVQNSAFYKLLFQISNRMSSVTWDYQNVCLFNSCNFCTIKMYTATEKTEKGAKIICFPTWRWLFICFVL